MIIIPRYVLRTMSKGGWIYFVIVLLKNCMCRWKSKRTTYIIMKFSHFKKPRTCLLYAYWRIGHKLVKYSVKLEHLSTSNVVYIIFMYSIWIKGFNLWRHPNIRIFGMRNILMWNSIFKIFHLCISLLFVMILL